MIDNYENAKQVAELIRTKCHQKFTVNVDIVDEVIDDVLKHIEKRNQHDCRDCKYVDCSGNCKDCPLYDYGCRCNLYIDDVLPCPYFEEDANEEK